MKRRSDLFRMSSPVPLLLTPIFLVSLAGCSTQGGGSAPVERVELAAIPATLKKACARPQLVPEKADYSIDEILDGWLLDAQHLETCRKRHAALVGAIEARDSIQGAGP